MPQRSHRPFLFDKQAPCGAKRKMANGFAGLIFFSFSCLAFAQDLPMTFCKKMVGDIAGSDVNVCEKVEWMSSCESVNKHPIFHFDKKGQSEKSGFKVLVLGLIHGDEPISGRLAFEWIKRLEGIEPRNSWRILPVVNPDGLALKTRTNANKVDLNRNFPTKDWTQEALKYWKALAHGEPRRYPGDQAASEPETKCVREHLKDFKPDFIVSVHTPYAVLDFDGPKVDFPHYGSLPWRALGNFPGSLGRYMWKDRSVPVLTVELKDKMVDPAELQDVIGHLVIATNKKIDLRMRAKVFDSL